MKVMNDKDIVMLVMQAMNTAKGRRRVLQAIDACHAVLSDDAGIPGIPTKIKCLEHLASRVRLDFCCRHDVIHSFYYTE
jgi:hypothetical protein